MIIAMPLWSQRCPVCRERLSFLKALAIEKGLLPPFFTCGHCGAKLSVRPPNHFPIIAGGPSEVVEIDETVNRFCPVCKKWEPHITYQDAEHTKSICSHCGAKLTLIKSPQSLSSNKNITLVPFSYPIWISDDELEEQ